MKEKVLHLNSAFTIKEVPSPDTAMPSIFIEGYASTNDIDRAGDVVPTAVWEKGIENYLKNPIILAHHEHDDPIGRMVEHRIDSKGLWIKARISAAAEEVYNLIKDKVLTAFSIGFKIIDAEYNAAAEVFLIKELELVEISVVSIPCNQNTLFELSKAFDTAEDYKAFKEQFAKKEKSAEELEIPAKAKGNLSKEWNMNPEELQKMLADAAAQAAEAATKALDQRVAKEKADKEAKEKADAELAAKIKGMVEPLISTKDNTQDLLKEVEKRIEEKNGDLTKALEGLRAEIAEKARELNAAADSKMKFGDKKGTDASYEDKEKAVLLGKIMNKSATETKFGEALATKYAGSGQSPHVANATWELEVSLNMEAEIRRRLVVAPLFRAINMQTNVMKIPVNPEAGVGTWMANTSFGTTESAGAAQIHDIREITLSAYKVATREYLMYEEEEDSLLVLLPVIRDGMIRRIARAVDRAFLYGAGSGADPVKGVSLYDATSVVVPTNTGAASIANMRALRKDLGAWGLDPSEVVYVVSTEVYYDLLDDTSFQTMDKVGTAATFLTGQVGAIGNSPVIVSGEFPTKAGGAATATTNIGAICVAPGNFLVGNQRGLRVDSQELVETQRRVLVASLRTGMTQVTTNLGQGVSTLRWS